MTLIIAKNGILAADRGAFCYTHKFPVSKIKLKKQKNIWRAASGAGQEMDIEYVINHILSKKSFSNPDLTKIKNTPGDGTGCGIVVVQKDKKTNKIQVFKSESYPLSKSPANNKFFLVNDDDNQFVTEGEIVARAIARSLHDIIRNLPEYKNNIPLQLFKIFKTVDKYTNTIYARDGINIVDINAKNPKIHLVTSEDDILKYFK